MNNEILEAKVRKAFEDVTRDDLIREIIKHPLNVTASKEDIPFDSLNKRFLNELKDNYISPDDVIEYLKRDEPQLLVLTITFAIHRYEKEIDLEKFEIIDNKNIKIYMNYLEETTNENTKTSAHRKKLEFRIPV